MDISFLTEHFNQPHELFKNSHIESLPIIEFVCFGEENFKGIEKYVSFGIRDPIPQLKKLKDLIGKNLEKQEEILFTAGEAFAENINNERSNNIIENTLFKDRNFFDITDHLRNNSWRIREGTISSLHQIRAFSKNKQLNERIERTLLERNVCETEKKVRLIISHPEWAIEMAMAMRNYWETEQQGIKRQIKEHSETLQELQDQINDEADLKKREKLFFYCQREQQEINNILNNLTSMQDQMGIVVTFIGEMRSQLFIMQRDLDEIKTNVKKIKEEVEYLTGKPIHQIFSIRKENCTKIPIFESEIYVPIRYQASNEENGSKDLMEDVLSFVKTCPTEHSNPPTTLLISGQSGSGKSVFIRRLEYEIWKLNKEEDLKKEGIIPIFCPLPSLENPLTDLVEETLEKYYGFDQRKIDQFKNFVSSGKYKIVFLLDGYDEVGPNFRYKPLYDTNDLELWGNPFENSFPRVITTCRDDHLKAFHGYESLFYPEISDSDPKQYVAKDYFLERQIASFKYQKNDYLNEVYLSTLEELCFEKGKCKDSWKRCKNELKKESGKKLLHFTDVERSVKSINENIYKEIENQIKDIWSAAKYSEEIESIQEIDDLFETPFMTQIIVSELKDMRDSTEKQAVYKKRLCEKLEKNQAEKIWVYILKKLNHCSGVDQKNNIFIKYIDSNEFKDFLKDTLKIEDEKLSSLINSVKSAFKRQKITPYDLYEAFTNRFFSKKLKKLKFLKNPKKIELTETDYKKDLEEYSHQLAIKMAGQGISRVNYNNTGHLFRLKSTWDTFFHPNVHTREVRSGCPISSIGRSYAFMHKSLQEFFVAREIYRTFTKSQYMAELTLVKETVRLIKVHGVSLEEAGESFFTDLLSFSREKYRQGHFVKKWTEEELGTFITSIKEEIEELKNFSVTNKMLRHEKAIWKSFLVNKIEETEFKNSLFSVVELSKIPIGLENASSVALSLLNLAGVSFRGCAFENIQAPNALLDYSDFTNANLEGADLTGSLMRLARFTNTNLDKVKMKKIKFGEYAALKGHEDRINSIAISLDGKKIVSGSRDKTLIIWSAEKQQLIRRLRGHTGTVSSVAFSPDGKIIVSGSQDKTLRIWDVESGESIGNPITGHSKAVTTIALSPDGKKIVSGSRDNNIRIWDIEKEKQIGKTLEGHSSTVNSLVFFPDEKRIVSGSQDGTLGIWNVEKEELIKSLSPNAGSIKSIAISPDGKRIASGSSDNTLIIWNVETEKKNIHVVQESIAKSVEQVNLVNTVVFSPDGKKIVSGGADNDIRIRDAETGTLIRKPLQGHNQEITTVKFFPDGKRIVSGSEDHTLRIWDIATEEPIGNPLDTHSTGINHVMFSSDGKRIISKSFDNLRVWDAKNGELIEKSSIRSKGEINKVAFSFDRKWFAIGSHDTLTIWDVKTQRPIGNSLEGYENTTCSLKFSPDERTIIGGSKNNTLRIWNTNTQEPIGKPLEKHEEPIACVAFSHCGKRVISGSYDKTLIIWNSETQEPIGKPLKEHEGPIACAAFSYCGKRVISGSYDQTLRIWDTETQEPIGKSLEKHKDLITCVAFSHCGKWIISGSYDQTLIIWDVETQEPIGEPLKGHSGAVYSLAFSPDGETIVSGSEDRSLRLWDKKGNCQCVIGNMLDFTGVKLKKDVDLDEQQTLLLIERGASHSVSKDKQN